MLAQCASLRVRLAGGSDVVWRLRLQPHEQVDRVSGKTLSLAECRFALRAGRLFASVAALSSTSYNHTGSSRQTTTRKLPFAGVQLACTLYASAMYIVAIGAIALITLQGQVKAEEGVKAEGYSHS